MHFSTGKGLSKRGWHVDIAVQISREEVDENLRVFKDGVYPPGSDELYGIYYDAITRAATPYGRSPMSVDEVAQELQSIGVDVPAVDLTTIGTRTGITPLQPHEVTPKLDAARGQNERCER